MRYFHRMECPLGSKRNEIVTRVTIWMNLKDNAKGKRPY